MEKFAASGYKKLHLDLTSKPFDPQKFQSTGQARTSFTGKTGLGGGVSELDLRKADDAAFMSLVKEHPAHAVALIYELLHANFGKEQSLIHMGQQLQEKAKAA
jgi:hypothetical protein